MASIVPPTDRGGFEIAIVCALKLERDAVEALLEIDFKEQGHPYGKAAQDRNAYTTGVLGGKPVVLAYPRDMGTLNAAAVASEMRYSYKNIKIALVVGVAGGVPRTPDGVDLLLGDIVISTAVIQYDFGRQYPNGFKRRAEMESTLGRAGTEVANFITHLTGARVTRLLEAKADLRQHRSEFATYGAFSDGPGEDCLFPSEYRHKHREPQACDICLNCHEWHDPVCEVAEKASCEEVGCERSVRLHRQARTSDPAQAESLHQPKIHFGRVASGNGVMKSGIHRDRVAKAEGVIAFEMEGAGTWDQIPTVVVKSVCDYADSHKNKAWQFHAAATAALCARAMLKEWELADRPEARSEPKTASAHTHRLLPRKARPGYFGYTDTLRRLERRLLPSVAHGTPPSQTVFVLVGMGGAGKSETVLQFVSKRYRSFWAVFWVDCSSENTARADFRRIAEKCEWPASAGAQVINEVKEHLSSSGRNVLIVLDNCDDTDTDYGEYIPYGEQVNILITSRLGECEVHATCDEDDVQDVEHLDGLDLDSAVNLVYQICQTPVSKKDNEKTAAETMVATLGCHPLAIISASSYVKEGRCSLEGYPALFQQRKAQMLAYGPKQLQSRSQNIFATFEVSAEDLSRSPDPAAQHALKMLEVLAFMDREAIGEDILTRAWEHEDWILGEVDNDGDDNDINNGDSDDDLLRLSSWHVTRSRHFLDYENPHDRILMFRDARAWLCRLSLARFDSDSGCLSMHPLVHDWARVRIKEVRSVEAWTIAASILALSTKERRYYESWSASLQRHLERCIAMQSEEVDIHFDSDRLQYCRLLYPICWQLYRVSSPMALSTVRKLIQEHGTWSQEHGKSASSPMVDYLFGIVLISEGELQQSQRTLETVVHRQQMTLPENDTDLLNSQHALAQAYMYNDQLPQAISILERVVDVESALQIDNRDASFAQHDLARAYLQDGRIAKAIEIFEHVIDIRQTLPINHKERLASQHELARAYLNDGQVAQAIEILEHVVDIWQTLPINHKDRLASQHELA